MDIAKVKVRLELEVDVELRWGRNCEVGQVADHAIDIAQKMVGRLVVDAGKVGIMRFVGKPEATAFMMPIGTKVR